MLDIKLETLLTVNEKKSFTKAAEELSLTQPAVSHHIAMLEEDLKIKIFHRSRGEIKLTPEGEIAVKYAKRIKALYAKMQQEIADEEKQMTKIRVGITHTSESNIIAEVLAKYGNQTSGISITIITDSINNLYDMLINYELDIAIVEGNINDSRINARLLDTDYLVCVMSNDNPLAGQQLVTLGELKKQKMILRLPTSATRILFESRLESIGETLADFDVMLEVDSIAAIKDLVRKDLGISILARSACMDELRKGKLTALPIENLSMIRETNIVYHRDFGHDEVLRSLMRIYKQTAEGK